MSKHETDVLVVGAGPVGLAAALFLAERGVAVEVIDQAPGPGRNHWSLALHPASLSLLDDLGVATALLNDGRRVDSVAFYDDAGRRARVRLDGLHAGFPFLLVVAHAALEAALARRLAERRVPVRWNHRLADLVDERDAALATVEELGTDSGGYAIAQPLFVVARERRVRARFVVGADGFHSTVRRRAGIALEPTAAPAAYASVELESSTDLGAEVRVVFAGDTTSVAWPGRGGRVRWAFELRGGDVPPEDQAATLVGARAWPDVDGALVERLLVERAPWFDAGAVTWSAHVRFAPALARRFGVGRSWLVGDAAHVADPVGMRSLNVGLAEAHDLASRLARVLQSGATDGLVAGYDVARTEAWRRLLELDAAATPGARADAWVAEHARGFATSLPGSDEDLVRLGRQVALDFAPA